MSATELDSQEPVFLPFFIYNNYKQLHIQKISWWLKNLDTWIPECAKISKSCMELEKYEKKKEKKFAADISAFVIERVERYF